MQEKTYYKNLVDRYTSKKASEEELAVFFHLLSQGKLDEYLSDSFLSAAGVEAMARQNETPVILLKNKSLFHISSKWAKIAIAACLIGIISVSLVLYSLYRPSQQKQITKTTQAPVSEDILPGGFRATLTLADGTSIILDSTKNGVLAQQENINIIRQGSGRIVYNTNKVTGEAPVISYNTITTPRGGQFEVNLPDGTKIWLNSASSLRYPTVFNGKERKVELEGECYFEVAHDQRMPFIVKMKNGIDIDVLGTHFNVHNYQDEPFKTTLLEGSVKVESVQGSKLLKPGQEVSLTTSGNLKITDASDPGQAIAWKNGFFQFNRADIRTVMHQIERWYNVQVTFEGRIPEKEFVGKVPMNSNLSAVLQILELSKIHFRIEGKKIIVLPD